VRKDGGGREWGEGIVHVGGENVSKVVDSSSPGVMVGEGAIASLPISLDKAIDVQGVDMVEEGAILQ